MKLFSDIIPEEQEFRHPVYVNPLLFCYQLRSALRHNSIRYSAPHEILINLRSFANEDKVIYQTRDNRTDIYRMTVSTFRQMAINSLHRSTVDDLEVLWMRLLLTNWHSPRIIDRGVILQHDHVFRQFLISAIKGGYDYYIGPTNRGQALYFKHRRLSSLHLLAVVKSLNYTNRIDYSHITVSFDAIKRGLVYECLRADPYLPKFSLHSYEPSDQDAIQKTNIRNELIRVIKHLITP